MTWDQHHSLSERLATDAESARRSGQMEKADELYRQAGSAEAAAFAALPPDRHRTRGVTAVSAVALWYKGRQYPPAERLAHTCLAGGDLPPFAAAQLQDLLHLIWAAHAAAKAGVHFVAGDVLVAVKGGEVVRGGAPLGLIVRKVEGIQAMLLRTVEMLLDRPLRRRGAPAQDIQELFKPWLFQAPAGSYQFAVRVEEPRQKDLWQADRPKVERVTSTFFSVLRASANDPDADLPGVIPDKGYREAFLNLSRNLAPTGKTFERLEVRDASEPSAPGISLVADTRQQLNAALRKARPARPTTTVEEPATIRGMLRGLHLDQDWLEIVTTEAAPGHVRIEDAGDVLDDVVGPMVNRSVVITAVRRQNKLYYRDIELEE